MDLNPLLNSLHPLLCTEVSLRRPEKVLLRHCAVCGGHYSTFSVLQPLRVVASRYGRFRTAAPRSGLLQ